MLASTLRPPSRQHGGHSHAAEVLARLPTGLPLGLDELGRSPGGEGRSHDRTGRGGSRTVVSAHQRPHTPPMEALPQDPPRVRGCPPISAHARPSRRARRGGDLGRGPSSGTVQCGGSLWTGTFQHRAGGSGAIVPLVLTSLPFSPECFSSPR